MNDRLKFFFEFSRREQMAIIALIIGLIILVLLNSWVPRMIKNEYVPAGDLDSLLKLYAEFVVEKEELPSRTFRTNFENIQPERSITAIKLKPFPFDPNRLDEALWRKMGLSERQIKNIQNYEAKGGKFVIKNDLRKLFTISDAEFEVLEPYIQLPVSREAGSDNRKAGHGNEAAQSENTSAAAETFIAIVELNSADSAALASVPGIRPWTAHRIIRHRQALGGFLAVNQLFEVHGIDSALMNRIVAFLDVNPDLIQKIAINDLAFKDLLRHPYIDFEKTKSIITHRDRRGLIRSEEELLKLQGFTQADIEKLRPYIRY